MPAKGYKQDRNHLLSKDFAERFNAKYNLDLDLKTIKRIIVNSNSAIAEVIADGNDGFKLPLGIGAIVAKKFKSKKKPVDQKNSKIYNKKIYHLNLHSSGFLFHITWFKLNIRKLRYISCFKFKACRELTREVAARGKKGQKYMEWNTRDFYDLTKLERILIKKYENSLKWQK